MELIGDIFERSSSCDNGVVVGGSSVNSDFCATVPFIKNKLKAILLNQQASGDVIEWVPKKIIG